MRKPPDAAACSRTTASWSEPSAPPAGANYPPSASMTPSRVMFSVITIRLITAPSRPFPSLG
ncbi:hypothetical protein [Modestobacter marinus]|uniref:hypothetical protein n=1 Tax=Modestobacter marinus TaxID=477641 RepID=UPI001C968AC4|nr:hypothetical protein [Modestobacter marinus]